MSRDARIDAYIAKAAEFARPILTHLREVVHAACPEAEETMKWGFPFFTYRGALLCNMAAHKAHATFGFWKGAHVIGDRPETDQAQGQFGRLTSVRDLPPKKTLVGYVKEAMRLIDEGAPAVSTKPARAKKPTLPTPDDLSAALATSETARTTFEAFSPSHRREYIEWIVDAKTDATRAKRIAQAIEWIGEGKSRNWKYQKA